MAAPEGNKFAEKWTRDEVLTLLWDMELTAKEEDCLYIGTLLVKYNLYKEIWSYWKDKFKDDDEVFQPIKKIEQVFESKLFSGGLTAKYNPAIVIFGLKNNHKWTDQPQPAGEDDKQILPLQIEGEGKHIPVAESEQEISTEKDERYKQ